MRENNDPVRVTEHRHKSGPALGGQIGDCRFRLFKKRVGRHDLLVRVIGGHVKRPHGDDGRVDGVIGGHPFGGNPRTAAPAASGQGESARERKRGQIQFRHSHIQVSFFLY